MFFDDSTLADPELEGGKSRRAPAARRFAFGRGMGDPSAPR